MTIAGHPSWLSVLPWSVVKCAYEISDGVESWIALTLFVAEVFSLACLCAGEGNIVAIFVRICRPLATHLEIGDLSLLDQGAFSFSFRRLFLEQDLTSCLLERLYQPLGG